MASLVLTFTSQMEQLTFPEDLLSHLIYPTTRWSTFSCYAYFLDEKTESPRSLVTCQRPHSLSCYLSQDSTLGIRKRFVAILPHLQLRLGSQAAGRLLCSQSSPQTVQYSFPRPFSPFNLCLIKWFPRGNPLWSLKGFHVWTNSSWKWNKIGNKFRPVLVEASLKQPRLVALERKSSQKK